VRICFVSAALPGIPCGVGDYTHRLATALMAEGVEPVVVTASRPGLRSDLPYEIRTVETEWRLGEMPRIAGTVLRTRPDVVHIEFPGSGYGRGFGATTLPWALLARRPRLATAMTFHEFDGLSRRFRVRLAAGALPCRLVVTVGGDLTQSVRRYLGWRPALRVVEIPIAANIGPGAATGRPPAPLRHRRGELLVGYWGFMRPDKGIDTLLDAFAELRTTGRPARLVLAGDPGPDGDYVRAVRDRLAGEDLRDDVVVTGTLSEEELSAVLGELDVCALPFRDGLTPNRGTYLAAVAHGVPVVTTSLTGATTDAARNTRFVEPGEPHALAAAISGLAGGREAAAPGREPGGRSRREPRAIHDPGADWAEIARRHVDAYRGILGTRA
jgi:glycosyltransferase involved in cell wall biosynthesis